MILDLSQAPLDFVAYIYVTAAQPEVERYSCYFTNTSACHQYLARNWKLFGRTFHRRFTNDAVTPILLDLYKKGVFDSVEKAKERFQSYIERERLNIDRWEKNRPHFLGYFTEKRFEVLCAALRDWVQKSDGRNSLTRQIKKELNKEAFYAAAAAKREAAERERRARSEQRRLFTGEALAAVGARTTTQEEIHVVECLRALSLETEEPVKAGIKRSFGEDQEKVDDQIHSDAKRSRRKRSPTAPLQPLDINTVGKTPEPAHVESFVQSITIFKPEVKSSDPGTSMKNTTAPPDTSTTTKGQTPPYIIYRKSAAAPYHFRGNTNPLDKKEPVHQFAVSNSSRSFDARDFVPFPHQLGGYQPNNPYFRDFPALSSHPPPPNPWATADMNNKSKIQPNRRTKTLPTRAKTPQLAKIVPQQTFEQPPPAKRKRGDDNFRPGPGGGNHGGTKIPINNAVDDFNLPHEVERKMLERIQQLLEQECYELTQRLGQAGMKEKWSSASELEINDWLRLTKQHWREVLFGNNIAGWTTWNNAGQSVVLVRHDAVHRNRVPVQTIKTRLTDALKMLRPMGASEDTITKLTRMKDELSSHIAVFSSRVKDIDGKVDKELRDVEKEAEELNRKLAQLKIRMAQLNGSKTKERMGEIERIGDQIEEDLKRESALERRRAATKAMEKKRREDAKAAARARAESEAKSDLDYSSYFSDPEEGEVPTRPGMAKKWDPKEVDPEKIITIDSDSD